MTNDVASHADSMIRSVVTSDVEHLATIQKGKNRRYTQLKPGKLQGSYAECNLRDVQLFRETLSIGMRIEAAPNAQYMPFAAAFSNTHDLKFCGNTVRGSSLLQATGGEWDACSGGLLNYVGAAFNRDTLKTSYFRLFKREFPAHWAQSKTVITCPKAFNQYLYILKRALMLMETFPALSTVTPVCKVLNDTVLHSAFNTLTPTLALQEKISDFSSRKKGVRKALDYLEVNARKIPTMTDLCHISGLSERSLQYGFKEYIGVSPVRYLRLLRLNEVRRELILSDHNKTKVTDVALNWGFVELGRFSGEYRKLFHELPSETLKARQKISA